MRPYYQDEWVTLYHGDCREVLPTLDAASFDTVLVDPPYNAPPETKKGGTTVRMKRWLRSDGFTYYDNDALLTPEAFHDFFSLVLEELDRVTVTGAHVYWFTTRYRFDDFRAYLTDPLYHLTERNWITWDKDAPGMGYYWRNQVEHILFLTKGKTQRYVTGNPNVVRERRVPPARLKHPHEKPVGLYERILQSAKATSVIDPFIGYGASLVASRNLGIKAVGIEADESYCALVAERLATHSEQLSLV